MDKHKEQLIKEFKSHLSLIFSIIKDSEQILTKEEEEKNFEQIRVGHSLIESNLKQLKILKEKDEVSVIRKLNEQVRYLESKKSAELDFSSIPSFILTTQNNIQQYFLENGIKLNCQIEFNAHTLSIELRHLSLPKKITKHEYSYYNSEEEINIKNNKIENYINKGIELFDLQNEDKEFTFTDKNKFAFESFIIDYFSKYGTINSIDFEGKAYNKDHTMTIQSISFSIFTTKSGQNFSDAMSMR